MTDLKQELNIVKEFTIEEVKIKIADDYCKDKTPEEVKEILGEIAGTTQENLTATALKECI